MSKTPDNAPAKEPFVAFDEPTKIGNEPSRTSSMFATDDNPAQTTDHF